MDFYVFTSNFPLFPVLCQFLLSHSWSVIKTGDLISWIRTKLNEKSLSFRGNGSRMNLLHKSRTFMTEGRPPFPTGIQVPAQLSSIPKDVYLIYRDFGFSQFLLRIPGLQWHLQLLPMSHCLAETLTHICESRSLPTFLLDCLSPDSTYYICVPKRCYTCLAVFPLSRYLCQV